MKELDVIYNIIISVCDHYDISYDILMGKRRDQYIVDARKIIVYFIMNHTNLTVSKIAKIMRKHHSTILHYRNHFNNLLGYNSYKKVIKHISNKYNFDMLQKKTVFDYHLNYN